MFTLIHLAFHLFSNSLALYLAARFIDGIEFTGDEIMLFATGAVMGIINLLIKPLIKIISFPLILLSFGLFSFIINMFLLWAVDLLIDELTIHSLSALFWGTLLVGLVNFVPSAILHHRKK